jgi:hypothetical protein
MLLCTPWHRPSAERSDAFIPAGQSRLHKAMYFPAVNALTWDPVVRAHCGRLGAAGKIRMVALAADMRKMLMLCYGVL